MVPVLHVSSGQKVHCGPSNDLPPGLGVPNGAVAGVVHHVDEEEGLADSKEAGTGKTNLVG